MRVITQADQRWALGSIKSLNLLANVLAMQTAADQGAQEAILLRDAHIIEGCSSNVFIVKNGQVFTTPEQPAMLSGITRQVVLRLLHQLSIPHQQGPLSADQLESADEIWLTSSTKEVTPVIAVNDQPVGDGQAGPLWHRVFQAYQTQLEADDE